MSLTAVQQIRLITQDNDPAFPFLSDAEIEYFLSINGDNVNRAAVAVCKVILLQLALRGNETVDIFSISSAKNAQEYRASLELFLRSPHLNPALSNATIYAGGISLADMQQNVDNPDNKLVMTPLEPETTLTFSTIKGNYA